MKTVPIKVRIIFTKLIASVKLWIIPIALVSHYLAEGPEWFHKGIETLVATKRELPQHRKMKETAVP